MNLISLGVRNFISTEQNFLHKSRAGRLKSRFKLHQLHHRKGDLQVFIETKRISKFLEIKKEESQISLKGLSQCLDDVIVRDQEQADDFKKGERSRALFIKYNQHCRLQERNRVIFDCIREYARNQKPFK